MGFLFSSSHLPASRVRRTDLEADDDHDENREAMPRSGGVRASSHLEGRMPEPEAARSTGGSPAPRGGGAGIDWMGRLKELAEQQPQRRRADSAAPDSGPRRTDGEHGPDAGAEHDYGAASGGKPEEGLEHGEHGDTSSWYHPPESGPYHPNSGFNVRPEGIGHVSSDPGFNIRSEDIGDASPDTGFYQHLSEIKGEDKPAERAGRAPSSSPDWRGRQKNGGGGQPPGGQRSVGPDAPAGTAPASGRTGAFPNSRLFETRPHPALAKMIGAGSGSAQGVGAKTEFSGHHMNLEARPAPDGAVGMLGQPSTGKPQTNNPPTTPSVPAIAAAPTKTTPASQRPGTPLSGSKSDAFASNASGAPDQKSNITIDDDHKSPFAQSVQNAMNREIQESPTTASLMEAVKALPNKVKIVPKTENGPATTSVADDGTVTIVIDLSKLSSATFGHELAHVIQRVAFQNESNAAPPADDPKNENRLKRARDKASEALNKIIPVKHSHDSWDDYTENEAVRITNIVNAERTAAKIKEQFKGRTNVSPEEITKAFWEAQGLKLEEGKHINNRLAIPMFTRYGDYDFEHIARTLGNGITPDMLKRVRNSMGYKAFNIPPTPPPPPSLPPPPLPPLAPSRATIVTSLELPVPAAVRLDAHQ